MLGDCSVPKRFRGHCSHLAASTHSYVYGQQITYTVTLTGFWLLPCARHWLRASPDNTEPDTQVALLLKLMIFSAWDRVQGASSGCRPVSPCLGLRGGHCTPEEGVQGSGLKEALRWLRPWKRHMPWSLGVTSAIIWNLPSRLLLGDWGILKAPKQSEVGEEAAPPLFFMSGLYMGPGLVRPRGLVPFWRGSARLLFAWEAYVALFKLPPLREP